MKKDNDNYYTYSLDKCTKCGGHDVKQTEESRGGVKVVKIYCHHCKTETRKRLISA